MKTIIQIGLIAAASCALAAGGPPTDSLTSISVSFQEECVFETLANRDHKFAGSVWLLAPIFVLRVPGKKINNL